MGRVCAKNALRKSLVHSDIELNKWSDEGVLGRPFFNRRRVNKMELASLEQFVDISLLLQMRLLISSLSGENKQFTEKQRNSLFGQALPSNSMQEQYGLSYPGEVLERYEERCGGGERQTRAIMLALAEGKSLLEDSMFVGRQLDQFLRKVRQSAKEDFYLSCALFLFSDKEEEKERLRSKLCRYPFRETQEAVLAIYALRDEPGIWEFAKDLAVRFFGVERTVKAYGNNRLYQWFLEQFHFDIRKYRKQDANLLKSLLDLPCKHVKEGSVSWDRLLETGYTEQEVMCLNMLLPDGARLPDVLDRNSITMERMALSGVRMLLNSEHLDDLYLMTLCKELIMRYMKYNICLEGNKGILESLSHEVVIKNHDVYQYLYQNKDEMRIPPEWFYVDFGEEDWSSITAWMSPDEFESIFGSSFYYRKKPDIEQWLQNFRKSTGKSYMDLFWSKNTYEVRQTFRLLITENKCDIVVLFNQYAEDKRVLPENEMEDKWKMMKANIIDAMSRLDHHEVYRFWDAFDQEYGICEFSSFMNKSRIILDNVVGRTSYYYQGGYIQRLDFKEEFLSIDEQRKLFQWVEQAFYREHPEQYESFLYTFLEDSSAKRLFPEQCKELFLAVMDTMEDGGRKQRLCRQYYTDEEWEAYQDEEKRRNEEKKQKERKEALGRCREDIKQALSTAGDHYEACEILAKRLSELRWKGDEFLICLNIFKEQMEICSKISKKAANRVAESVVDEFGYNRLDWSVVQEIIGKMEVVVDDGDDA